MKADKILYLIILATSVIGCSSDKQLESSLPSIDVRKDYPEKEIILTPDFVTGTPKNHLRKVALLICVLE